MNATLYHRKGKTMCEEMNQITMTQATQATFRGWFSGICLLLPVVGDSQEACDVLAVLIRSLRPGTEWPGLTADQEDARDQLRAGVVETWEEKMTALTGVAHTWPFPRDAFYVPDDLSEMPSGPWSE